MRGWRNSRAGWKSGRGTLRIWRYWVPAGSCDGVLLDLGVSSPQLDTAARGFSFQHDGPLDMRMDTRQTLTAAELVNRASMEELASIFRELGGERDARRLARGVVSERESRPFATTRQLAGLDRTSSRLAAPGESAPGDESVPGVAASR